MSRDGLPVVPIGFALAELTPPAPTVTETIPDLECPVIAFSSPHDVASARGDGAQRNLRPVHGIIGQSYSMTM